MYQSLPKCVKLDVGRGSLASYKAAFDALPHMVGMVKVIWDFDVNSPYLGYYAKLVDTLEKSTLATVPAHIIVDGSLSADRGKWVGALTAFGNNRFSCSEHAVSEEKKELDELAIVIGARKLDGRRIKHPPLFDLLNSIAKGGSGKKPGTDDLPNELLKELPFPTKVHLW